MASESENRSYADLTASYIDRQRQLLQVQNQGFSFRLGEALRLAMSNAKTVADYRAANSGTILNPSSVDKMSDEEVLKAALLEQAGKSKQAYISADIRTPLEKQRLLNAFKVEDEKNTLRKLIETNSEAMDRTFGAIPVVGSVLRAGRTLALRDLNGYSPYGLLDAGTTLLDLGTSAFGLGGWKPLVGGYIGGEVGRLIGEKYDHPVLGLFVGALAGGFTPHIATSLYLNGRRAYDSYQISRAFNNANKQGLEKNILDYNFYLYPFKEVKKGTYLYRNPSEFSQSVKTSGTHKTTAVGPITGSRFVDDPNNPTPIKYSPSRVVISTELRTPEMLYVQNYKQLHNSPRGTYVESGIDYDRTIDMKYGFRPNIERTWVNPENLRLIFDLTSNHHWPMTSTGKWLSNKDLNWFWTDLQKIPITLSHKEGGKINEKN